MIRKTEQNFGGQSLRQTMVQGLKALGGREVPNYTLLYLDPTSDKKRGDYQAIVVPYIEVGRSAECVIQYGDNYPTVSRKHASLSWEGNEIVLKHMGKNPTFVNGSQIHDKWFLKNGDEIQFAVDGPKIRFNATPTKTSTMKFTDRFIEFSQQALRPYRKAVMALSILIVALAGFTVFSLLENRNEMAMVKKENRVTRDSLLNEIKILENKIKNTSGAERKSIEAEIRLLKGKLPILVKDTPTGRTNEHNSSEASELEKFEKYIYFIYATKCEVTLPGEDKGFKTIQLTGEEGFGFSGTGFLTSDGKFVTARHIIQPWVFEPKNYNFDCEEIGKMNDIYIALNQALRVGGKVLITFVAKSSSGDSFTFTSEVVTLDDSKDLLICDGNFKAIRSKDYNSDWAFIRMSNKTSNIKIDYEASRKLSKGESIYALGYPRGMASQKDWDNLQPHYGGPSIVTQSGLVNGVINVNNSGIEGGMSGGPMFYKKDGNWVVVGLVSATSSNSQMGIIVSASNIW